MTKLERFKKMLEDDSYKVKILSHSCPQCFGFCADCHEDGCEAHWVSPYNDTQTLAQKVAEKILADDNNRMDIFCPRHAGFGDWYMDGKCCPIRVMGEDIPEKCRQCWGEECEEKEVQ